MAMAREGMRTSLSTPPNPLNWVLSRAAPPGTRPAPDGYATCPSHAPREGPRVPSSLLNKACFTDSTVEFPREVAYFCTQEGVVQQSARQCQDSTRLNRNCIKPSAVLVLSMPWLGNAPWQTRARRPDFRNRAGHALTGQYLGASLDFAVSSALPHPRISGKGSWWVRPEWRLVKAQQRGALSRPAPEGRRPG